MIGLGKNFKAHSWCQLHRPREVSNIGGDRSGPRGSGGRKPPAGSRGRNPLWGFGGKAPKKILRKMLTICLFSCISYTRNIIDQKHHCNFYTYPQKLVGIIPGIRNFGGDKSRYPPRSCRLWSVETLIIAYNLTQNDPDFFGVSGFISK